ncbi:MAG: ATP-binding cassette domain-containing protein [Pseudomonadota bacterium]
MSDCADKTDCAGLTSLRTKNLGLSLDGAAKLADITLDLPPAGITILMGPNGAGKSLLLLLLHGLMNPSAGEILWSGRLLDPQITMRQSLVFQRPVLLRRTVAGNIDFILRARGRSDTARRDLALREVGLNDMAKAHARALSGGEQQRLALARALITDPDVLFLDEPTANLDPTATGLIEKIVRRTAEAGTKVIFVTHDPGQARRLADDVVFLNRGRIAKHADAGSFFSDPGHEAARAYLAGELPL